MTSRGKPDPGEPYPRPFQNPADPLEHATEAVGTLLWTQFALGVAAKGIEEQKLKAFGVDAIQKGRDCSRGWIYDNLRDKEFDLDATSTCARECGRLAWEQAEKNCHEIIDEDDFMEAWRLARLEMQRVARVARRWAGKDDMVTIMAGACS